MLLKKLDKSEGQKIQSILEKIPLKQDICDAYEKLFDTQASFNLTHSKVREEVVRFE